MNETKVSLQTWAFAGPLADAPQEVAWTLVLLAALSAAVLAWVSYRSAVHRIGVAPAALLSLLRVSALGVLLFCLANPVRIERQTRRPTVEPEAPPPAARLAVVVDRSDSMTLPDNRGKTRLESAVATWRRLAPMAQTFAVPRYYSFGGDLRPAATLEEALSRTGGTSETRLYDAILSVVKQPPDERPDAIVVLTDGVDTSRNSDEALREAAQQARVTLYFIAGTNRSARPEPFVRVREWRAPPSALADSEFMVEATFESFSRADRTVPFSIWQGSRRIHAGELALTTGANVIPRSFPVLAGDPGVLELTLRLGATADAPLAARATTRVQERKATTLRVLVYQGALDWGLRHFTEALRTDPTFEFTTIVTPDAGLRLARASRPGAPAPGRLPDAVDPLRPFDCVVLAHAFPSQLGELQQRALVDFARQGGAVLIMSPNSEAIRQFEAGPLKAILPVEFAPLPVAPTPQKGFLERMRDSWKEAPRSQSLETFELTDAGKASPVFARADGPGERILPRFIEFTPLVRPRPAAEVLAFHPTSRDPVSGARHVLLAVERFGRGRAAVLASDSLWRWKLSEPSTSRIVETFWQQLLLAIAHRPEIESLRFTHSPAQVHAGERVVLQVGGVTTPKSPVAAALSPSGKRLVLPVTPSPDGEGWNVVWTPQEPGAWAVVAGVEGAFQAHLYPTVRTEVTGELARSTPALDAMRTLATATGGALLGHEPPPGWKKPEPKPIGELEAVTTERRRLEWNTWNILWAALGCFGLELILRRAWRLL